MFKEKRCVFCDNKFITSNKRIFCSLICRNKQQQHDRKFSNPERYREYLNRQNKKRRDLVRNRLGLPLDHPQINESGKGFKLKDGYIYVLNKKHPNAAKSGYVAEHIVIMTQHIGRPLRKGENIHHKNGIRDDNRIENLELWVNTCRQGQRIEDKIKWCVEFLNEYGYNVIKKD